MHENKNIFLMSWRKLSILILNLYLYSIKIQTDIDQNAVKNIRENHKNKIKNIYLEFFFRLGPARPMWLGWTQLVSTCKRAWTIHARLLQSRCNQSSSAQYLCIICEVGEVYLEATKATTCLGPLSSPFRLFFFSSGSSFFFVSVCRLSRFLLPCSLVQLEAKLVLGDEDDGWQCFFLCVFFSLLYSPLSFSILSSFLPSLSRLYVSCVSPLFCSTLFPLCFLPFATAPCYKP